MFNIRKEGKRGRGKKRGGKEKGQCRKEVKGRKKGRKERTKGERIFTCILLKISLQAASPRIAAGSCGMYFVPF